MKNNKISQCAGKCYSTIEMMMNESSEIENFRSIDDSSSEDTQTNLHQITSTKPVVPARPRNLSASRNNYNINRQSSSTNMDPNWNARGRSTEAGDSSGKMIYFFKFSVDKRVFNKFSWFAVNSQFISSLVSQLLATSNSVMELHQKLKNSSEPSAPGQRNNAMLKELEDAVTMTQKILTKISSNR